MKSAYSASINKSFLPILVGIDPKPLELLVAWAFLIFAFAIMTSGVCAVFLGVERALDTEEKGPLEMEKAWMDVEAKMTTAKIEIFLLTGKR